jgi:hypothetical protein
MNLMVVLLAAIITYGTATYYSEGVMQVVVENRISYGQLPQNTNPERAVALLTCDLLGNTVWIETPNHRVIPVIVADCAQEKHKESLMDNDFAVDLSWELSRELGVIGSPMMGFTVWDEQPISHNWN